MVDLFWLECDTCQHGRREGEGRFCSAQGRTVERPLVVECPLWREREHLSPEVRALLVRRYSGLY
jgi:hypothetical protein